MICNKCNHKLPDDSEYCQYCGNNIEIPQATAEELQTISEEKAFTTLLAKGIVEGHKAVEANKTAQPQNELDPQFGLVPEKPIFTRGFNEQKEYLKSLRGENGEPLTWERQGSMAVENLYGLVDIYNIYLNNVFYKTIYINLYGAYLSNATPKGFKFASEISHKIDNEKKIKYEQINNKALLPKRIAAILSIFLLIILYLVFLTVFSTERDTYICYTTKTGDNFHSATCSYLNTAYETTVYEASKNYNVCKYCNPCVEQYKTTIIIKDYILPIIISFPISTLVFLLLICKKKKSKLRK